MTRAQGLRLLLAAVALSALVPGLWATLSQDTFYSTFPAGGAGWVAPLGPPSPHLTADVGAFYLAFTVLFAWAAWRPSRELVLPLLAAWTLFSLLHLGWHTVNLQPFGTANAVGQLVSLAVVLALPLFTLRLLPPTQAPAASQLA